MDRLWSPWRYQFITGEVRSSGCPFCEIAAAPPEQDETRFVVHRAQFNFILLNLYPYTAGHMMVVPYAHVAALGDAGADATAEMMRLTVACEKSLSGVYGPDGINLGMNLGSAAGAGIAAHIHMHILPRWKGDANFLSTIGETRMLPEELPVTWKKLRAWWTTHATEMA